MPSLAEIRTKYPQYADMPDDKLAGALHQKFYSDMPFADFSQRVGYQPPTEADANAAEGLPEDFPRHSPTEGTGDWWKKELKSLAYPQTWGRQAKLAGRSVIEGVSALPLTAADMGVSARNMLTGSEYEMPSQMSKQSLSTVLPEPRTGQEKVANFAETLLAGAKLPVPQAKVQAPAGFVKPNFDAVRQATLAASQKAGYVVPPSTTNPTAANTFMESFGGKIATAQDAALKNQNVTNTLAKQALGLTDDAPIAQESLKAVRSEAGKAYETLRQVGAVSLDDASTKTLDEVAAKFTGSKIKEALGGGNDIPKIVQALKDEPLTGDTAVDAMQLLRDKADEAYRAGQSQIGKGYKAISKAIEDLMEKQLSGDALNKFRKARTLIAKTHTVEGAFNPATGNVVGTKLAAQLGRGKPLSGDLLTAAKFSQAFPKAAREMVDSGSVRNTDAILGSGAAVFSGHPWYLGWPFLRQGARSFLLSEAGQGMAQAKPGAGIPPEVANMLLQTAAQSARK
jgi:hypothetical protein